METNALPQYDDSLNPTGCCPRFNPEGWDGQELHLRGKPFVRATTRSLMHVPLDMGKVFARVDRHVEASGGWDRNDTIVLSRDISPFRAEHLFAVAHPVEGEETVTLSGDFITRVYEGPYREVRHWHEDLSRLVRARGKEPGRIYFFYTTCPKCAAVYGRNHVVGVAEV